jgi:glycosyltransferase involved in cell wall biosynthesis
MAKRINKNSQLSQHRGPVKILFITPFSWLYGEALSLLQLVRSLERDQYAPIVITTGHGPLIDELEQAEIPVKSIRMPYLSRRGMQAVKFAVSLIPISVWLSRFIAKNGVELVCNNTLLNPYGALAADIARVPCVWFVHEVGRASSLRNYFIKLTGLMATRLVVVSESICQLYSESAKEKIRVVYNGIDQKLFNPDLFDSDTIRISYGIHPTQPVITIIGRLHQSKHHNDLLVATKQLVNDFPDLVLLVIGDGPLNEQLHQQTCDLGLEQNVRFLGYMEDVREVLSISDVLVLPSEHEAFGRVVAEAMLMEKPVVATNVGGLPELVSPETGVLVPVQCPEELGDAIKSIIIDPIRKIEMGRRGRERALELFTLDQYVVQMKNVFDELLKKSYSEGLY